MKQWRSTICLIAAALTLAGPPIPLRAAQAETEHQYARLREVKLELNDFSFPTPTGATLNLRDAARSKRLVIVSYFAAWCHNSNYDVTTLNELYLKYHEQGLAVVGVCEYSSAEELRGFVDRHKPVYPICFESTDQIKDRSTTTHHRYRKQANDKRKWGTPFNVMISTSEIEERGETVARRVRVAAGELIKAEVEELIRQQLSASSGNEKPPTIK